jgi:glyoxylate reductase
MARVFVTRPIPGTALDRLRERHEVEVWDGDGPPPPAVLHERAATADGLLPMVSDPIDAELIAGAPSLRAVANYGIGSDNIDKGAAAARGIAVGVTPDVLTDATADLAWALLLAAARRLPEAAASVPAGEWASWEPQAFLGAEVAGATLGVIGPGRIGSAVAERASGFRMEVLTAGRDRDAVDDLLARADFVSLHCPLTDETRGLIGQDALRRMKPTAILVNTARGPIVDTGALIDALHAGEIAGAGLDVTDPEPLPSDHPLLRAPNAIVLPHIGSATTVARSRMADRAVDNLLAALDGEPMPYPVA